ncbi:MAG: hypothetical protein FWC43_00535 [Planctomycetaceae bacterium]|nr:hypothetical protein [Planctomycetaceae bacterium]
MKRTAIAILVFFVLGLGSFTHAASLGVNLLNPKRVDADPKKVYRLEERNGPWMIVVKRFSGENAEENANKLVYELRSKYKLNAYLFDKEFKFSVSDGMKAAERKQYTKEKYVKPVAREYIVLVGDFQSAEDKDYKEALQKIKTKFPPEILQVAGTQAPLIGAFGTLNPLLPPDFLNPKGYVDAFIERLNSDSKYSLLNNPGRFTVRVATFTGETIIKQDEVKQILNGRSDKKATGKTLAQAGVNASELCAALRKQGVDAYEFHDRYSSIVTVGSFNEVGTMGPQGTVEPIPEIARIFEAYKGVYRQPTADNMLPYMPKSLGGIEFDVQPTVIMVPKKMRK